MPKKATKSTATVATVEESTVATSVAVEDVKNVKKNVKVEPLKDSDEIEVVSLTPNVSYKDNYTNDMYRWDEVGHIEPMSYETLRNMWRNAKGYFKNLWIKPLDERVIQKFGLTNTYEKYEFLMDESNYTRANINKICTNISSTPIGVKFSICTKVKDMVVSGAVTDIAVIRALEKHLDLDLISFLD